MSSLLQMQAQYESLATQYDTNQAQADLCAARHDDGKLWAFS
jgi:hypothetical protein